MSSYRTNSMKSGTAKSFTSVNIMDVPSYDNGRIMNPPAKVSTVSSRRPLIQAPTRVVSQQVKYGVIKPSSNRNTPTHTGPPSDMAKYLNKPLPKLPPPGPKSASSASRPKGVTKPQGLPAHPQVHIQHTIPRKPVPPPTVNHHTKPLVGPAGTNNNHFTKTGQYIPNKPLPETSAFSATTVSTSAQRKAKKSLTNKLKPYSHEIISEAQKRQFREQQLRAQAHNIMSGRNNVIGGGRNGGGSSGGGGHKKEMEMLKKMIHNNGNGNGNGNMRGMRVEDTNEWKVLCNEERAALRREMEVVSVRRFYGLDKHSGGGGGGGVNGKGKGGNGKGKGSGSGKGKADGKGCVVM